MASSEGDSENNLSLSSTYRRTPLRRRVFMVYKPSWLFDFTTRAHNHPIMMEKFWKAALAVGGVAAIGAFVFWSLYKQWLALPIFSTLSANQTFAVMLVFLFLTFLALAGFLFAYIRGGKTSAQTGTTDHAFALHESWNGVNEVDCKTLVGPDVVKASRAMSITATSWLSGLVDKEIIIRNHLDDYETLYTELTACGKVVPGFERTGKTGKDFVTREMKKALDEMQSYRSGGTR